jgi:arginyl-tRNA synthetase
MNLFQDFRDRANRRLDALALAGRLPAGLDLSACDAEAPRDPAHGDIALNAAMVLARPAGMKPRAIADMLAPALAEDADVASAEVAGPGFINLRLADAFWHARVPEILHAGLRYGRSDLGGGRRVNVEYVSANPTGPMHVGHCRGAVFGDALANLLAFTGHTVTREYYVNDAGAQVDVLARSAYLRYRAALGEPVGDIPDGLYPGEYLVPVGEALAEAHGEDLLALSEAEWLPTVRAFAVDAMMVLIKADLDSLGIRHEVFSSERRLHADGLVEQAVAFLEARGLLYTGTLEPPKGKPPPEDWEPRAQLLFRATRFGDEVDRPLRKSDGAWTYFAADIAYHYDKFRRGFADMIDVLGADHGGYVKRMKAAVAAMTESRGALDVKLCQLVRLFRAGAPVKMSKRAGSFVTLRDVVDEVGRDAVRFMMLYRKNDAPLDFDFAKVTEQSKDNAVFYVQYAHARAHSVLRNARGTFPGVPDTPDALATVDLTPLRHPDELGLIKRMAAWPRLVESAATSHEPHRIAFFLSDLSADFHALWNKGNDDPSLRFLMPADRDLSLARLALVSALSLVIASGLAILGVGAPEEMR